jgi:hypothetical protein
MEILKSFALAIFENLTPDERVSISRLYKIEISDTPLPLREEFQRYVFSQMPGLEEHHLALQKDFIEIRQNPKKMEQFLQFFRKLSINVQTHKPSCYSLSKGPTALITLSVIDELQEDTLTHIFILYILSCCIILQSITVQKENQEDFALLGTIKDCVLTIS